MSYSPKTGMKQPDFHKTFKEAVNTFKETPASESSSRASRFFSGGNHWHTTAAIVVGVAIAAILIGGSAFAYQWRYQDAFYPGTRIAGISLGGQSFTDAQQTIAQRADYIEQNGLPIRYENVTFNLIASPVAASPDSTFDIFAYDINKTLVTAWSKGRNGNIIQNSLAQMKLLLFSPDQPMQGHMDRERVDAIVRARFSEFETPAKDATIVATADTIAIQPEATGEIFHYEDIVNQLIKNFHTFTTDPIVIALQTEEPRVHAAELQAVKDDAAQALEFAPLTLVTPTTTSTDITATEFTITKNDLAQWLGTQTTDNIVTLSFKPDLVTEWLATTVAPAIDIEPVNAKFSIDDSGKVSEFKSSRGGYKTNVPATFSAMNEHLHTALTRNATTVPPITIAMDAVRSEITNENVNDLGITERIGTGHSNFAGSPANRRHNIRIGAASVNGTLLAPGEEFSLLDVLGDINASTGYLPELVIKGNETVPEYGGGLCQIGTTVFRGTLNTGLPVTARRNHSYRVSYYEPAGTDATIYDPAPDYKFVNDTGHHVLIQSRIEGDDLYFDFWGTDDGRVADVADPVIYNITPPPPTKLIETTDLAPGQRRCTESAHSGADAYLDYAVTYADGTVKEKRFTSHYRPWQEVCLIGVEPEAPADPAPEEEQSEPANENEPAPANETPQTN